MKDTRQRANTNRRGFIGLIIVLVFALALSKYFFDWNIIEFIKSPKVLEIFTYIKKFAVIIWNTVLVKPAVFIWNDVVLGIIWKSIVLAYELLKGFVDSK